MWPLHTYTLWSRPHQSVTGMKHRQMQCALSSQQYKQKFKALKNGFTFPQAQLLGEMLTIHGEGFLYLSSYLQVRFSKEWLGNCGRAPLEWACPEPACNASKASCFTSLVILNKLKSRSAANKLQKTISYEQL